MGQGQLIHTTATEDEAVVDGVAAKPSQDSDDDTAN